MHNSPIPERLTIGSRAVGPGHAPLLIAEIGINHNGCVQTAQKLIEAACRAGAHAVKFQKRHLPSLYTREVLENLENQEQAFQYVIPLLREFELDLEKLASLKKLCDRLGILFLCTPFDLVSLAELEEISPVAYKVASADLTDVQLLDALAATGKPLLLSTGMSVETEVRTAISQLRAQKTGFALLHCVSTYPVDPRNADLERIPHLARTYRCPVGYSSHDLGIELSLRAAALGAAIVEKHFTLDRGMRGMDHRVSLLPDELERLAAALRDPPAAAPAEFSEAREKREILQGEAMNQRLFRKSIVARVAIPRGRVIEADMLALKAPGSGLSGQRLSEVIGRIAPRDFAPDEAFHSADIAESGRTQPTEPPQWGVWGMIVRYHDFESVLEHAPRALEFHLTYGDLQQPVPHEALAQHRDVLSKQELVVHCCEYVGEELLDLCSVDSGVRERSLATLQRAIDIAAELAPYFAHAHPKIVFNCGAMTALHAGPRAAIDRDTFFRGLESLALKSCKLLAQNMAPCPWYFGGQWRSLYLVSWEDLLEFCSLTGHSLCLDVSHASMACHHLDLSITEFLERLRPHVGHVHLGDSRSVDGEGLQIDEGEFDFTEFFRIYRDFQGTWTPEIWQGHMDRHRGALLALARLSAAYRRSLTAETFCGA